MKEISLISTPAESHTHKKIKLLLYNQIHKNNNIIVQRSLEKYFGNRIADIYFKLKTGQEIVVEIQNSKISVNEIINRTKDYNKKGLFILWILHGKGKCTASPKFPRDGKATKISPAEKFLHQMYGGRVYYMNILFHKNNPLISVPFALHFSKLIKKKKNRMFKTRYDFYFYRNSNYIKIPNMNLLCTEFLGYKIARFYDKNLKSTLKEEILRYYHTKYYKTNKERALLEQIIKNFKKKYGVYLILNALIELSYKKKIEFNQKILKRIQRKVFI